MSKELNLDTTLELVIEEPTPVTTTRTAWNAPAIPEGRLELIYPPHPCCSPVRYAEARKPRRTSAGRTSIAARLWALACMSLE